MPTTRSFTIIATRTASAAAAIPCPDLAKDGDWLEAPFWAWHTGDRRRGKLLVRRASDAWQLRVGSDIWPSIPCNQLDRAGRSMAHARITGLQDPFARLDDDPVRSIVPRRRFHSRHRRRHLRRADRPAHRTLLRDPGAGLPRPLGDIAAALPRYPDALPQTGQLARQWRDLVFKPERFVSDRRRRATYPAPKHDWIARAGATMPSGPSASSKIRASTPSCFRMCCRSSSASSRNLREATAACGLRRDRRPGAITRFCPLSRRDAAHVFMR